jgi:ribosomal protein S18 acetylase RimI-like enzyme
LTEIVRAGQGDIAPLSETLSLAFFPDPVSAYLFPDESRRVRRLKAFFQLQLEGVYLPKGEVYTTADRTSAALWLPPGTRPPGPRVQLAYLTLALRSRSLRRGRRLAAALYRLRPRKPHYYLGTVGTDPRFQRHGLASTLIDAVLARLDQRAIPAYLEASSAPNVRLYTSLGFAVVSEVTIERGGPTLWTMWREPVRA